MVDTAKLIIGQNATNERMVECSGHDGTSVSTTPSLSAPGLRELCQRRGRKEVRAGGRGCGIVSSGHGVATALLNSLLAKTVQIWVHQQLYHRQEGAHEAPSLPEDLPLREEREPSLLSIA